MLLFLPHPSFAVSLWGDQPITCLLLTLSFLFPHTTLMSSFTMTINLLFALPLVLLLNGSSLLCPSQCGLISKTSNRLRPPDVLIPDPSHPAALLFHRTWLVSPLFCTPFHSLLLTLLDPTSNLTPFSTCSNLLARTSLLLYVRRT